MAISHQDRKRMIELNFPTVIKVSSSYGGYGKMVAHNKKYSIFFPILKLLRLFLFSSEFGDIESILCLQNDFYTEEPFIKHLYEFRVQA